jgi:tRNA nucleotidyltransferase (CCA-adding enzyme)
LKLILTHSNADFDAVAASLAAHKLNPDATPVLPDRLNRNVDHFLILYRNGLPFKDQRDFQVRGAKQVILVDTQRLPSIKGIRKNIPLDIIDHHQPFMQSENIVSEAVGATTTLLIEQIQARNITINALEATLMALGIYEDTGSLSYGTTTPRDVRAAAWLLENNAQLDTVRRFLSPPLNEEQQDLFEKLLTAAENREVQGVPVIVGAVKLDRYISEISSVVHRLRDILESEALFVVVQMPDNLVLVCRSTGDVLDVGKVAQHFGGGGHSRAAAATIYDKSLRQVVSELWEHIRTHIRPVIRVADLMSYGVQTINADKRVSEVVQQMRRIGHEGFPVIDQGRIVGLLARREVDRAMEHGLNDMTVRDIMESGEITLKPNDSVFALEEMMVESGWGQIPVVDDQQKLIGIVTRTDLIKHWARTHPTKTTVHAAETFSLEQIGRVLGEPAAKLIDLIARHAQEKSVNLYMVGGVVRDLFLNRPNLDIDFVAEGSAIELAKDLCEHYGGEVHSFQPFGTAKWILDPTMLDGELPAHVDFAGARYEFYEHPTALPTVYQSGIKLDLQRRDFTINTLAIQLSPATGPVLDYYGGLADLRTGRIRVLHSLSFVDDPTRILRAMRFERRLNFKIEDRTAELMTTALPMLRRITGERVRNELDLLLQEHEPEHALLNLQARGVLENIHPVFQVDQGVARCFQIARQEYAPWHTDHIGTPELYWHIIFARIDSMGDLAGLSERLLMSKKMADSLFDAAMLYRQMRNLDWSQIRRSQIAEYLKAYSEVAILTGWLIAADFPVVRDHIQRYMLEWQHIQPILNGNDLRDMGLKPGPCYSVILKRLRGARLDGETQNEADERKLVEQWVEEERLCE